MLKKVEAIVRKEALDTVASALRSIGIIGMNVVEVRGRGRQSSADAARARPEGSSELISKVLISIILSDRNVEKTIETIIAAARTGREGDGIIFIYPVDDVVRIRTGERGGQALSYSDDIDQKQAKR
jgi:nitrogen regulatory protein P-II 1